MFFFFLTLPFFVVGQSWSGCWVLRVLPACSYQGMTGSCVTQQACGRRQWTAGCASLAGNLGCCVDPGITLQKWTFGTPSPPNILALTAFEELLYSSGTSTTFSQDVQFTVIASTTKTVAQSPKYGLLFTMTTSVGALSAGKFTYNIEHASPTASVLKGQLVDEEGGITEISLSRPQPSLERIANCPPRLSAVTPARPPAPPTQAVSTTRAVQQTSSRTVAQPTQAEDNGTPVEDTLNLVPDDDVIETEKLDGTTSAIIAGSVIGFCLIGSFCAAVVFCVVQSRKRQPIREPNPIYAFQQQYQQQQQQQQQQQHQQQQLAQQQFSPMSSQATANMQSARDTSKGSSSDRYTPAAPASSLSTSTGSLYTPAAPASSLASLRYTPAAPASSLSNTISSNSSRYTPAAPATSLSGLGSLRYTPAPERASPYTGTAADFKAGVSQASTYSEMPES
jgi:hypothetical protein